MLDYIKGNITSFNYQSLTIETGGLGIKLLATTKTIEKLKREHPKLPSSAQLPVYLHIKEDKWECFGFVSELEKNAFLLLLNCRGVGPKSALNIINDIEPSGLVSIAFGNETCHRLEQVSGIGSKTAQRIAMELKDQKGKMKDWQCENDGKRNILSYTHEDLFNALRNLGYRSSEIQMAIGKLNPSSLSTSLPDAIRQLLKTMGR